MGDDFVDEGLNDFVLRFGDDSPPDLNCFFISGDRHDKDRVEIQFGFDGLVHQKERRFEYDVDLVIFAPNTLNLMDVNDPSQYWQEFQSYVRLHTHTSNPKSDTSYYRVRERLGQLAEEATDERIRTLAVEFEAFLKAQSKRIRKEIGKLLERSELEKIVLEEIAATRDLLAQFRSLLETRNIPLCNPADREPGTDHDLLLLNEYLSHLIVQYASSIQRKLERVAPHATKVLESIRDLSIAEARLRDRCRLLIDDPKDPDFSHQEDGYLRRIGTLKKYFQRTLFVEIVGRPLQKKLTIPVYTLSAVIAGLWAVLFQLYQSKTLSEHFGINSMVFVLFAILAYVARDLLKDFGKSFFFSKGRLWFPDYEKELFLNLGGRRRKVGEIDEFLKTTATNRLPETLRKARYSIPGGEMEERLHEDILHFRKKVTLDLTALDSQKEFPWGVREIVRFRFDRLLISMEDAFKTLHLLDAEGQVRTRLAHRTYQVIFATWISKRRKHGHRLPVKPAFKAFRVTLDKTGIIECEPVRWKQEFGVPDVPN